MTTPSLAGPPAYLLRETLLPRETGPTESPDDPPGAGAQVVMPAIMALVEAGESGESPENLPLVIEALLFAAEEPPTVSQLAQATRVSRDAIEEALDELAAAAAERGLRVQRDGGSVRLVTAPEAAPSIQRLLGLDRPNKLSKAALETLAIIAYQQPVTRGAVERVRGVTCDAPLATLRGRELIASIGQADTPGRPHLWATTPAFLDHFGLTALTELPPLPGVPAPVAQGALDLDVPCPRRGRNERRGRGHPRGRGRRAQRRPAGWRDGRPHGSRPSDRRECRRPRRNGCGHGWRQGRGFGCRRDARRRGPGAAAGRLSRSGSRHADAGPDWTVRGE